MGNPELALIVRSGSQSQGGIWLILPTCGTYHTIKRWRIVTSHSFLNLFFQAVRHTSTQCSSLAVFCLLFLFCFSDLAVC